MKQQGCALHNSLYGFKRGQLVSCELKVPKVAQATQGRQAVILCKEAQGRKGVPELGTCIPCQLWSA